MDNEIWRPVWGYDGRYEVSNYGQVRSRLANRAVKILKPRRVGTGYMAVEIDGKSMSIHRLVARAFIEIPRFVYVNHKNGIKHDNRISNLEWCTPKLNVAHAIKIGLNKDQKGENNNAAKLTWKKVEMIRQQYVPYKISTTKLGKKFGVSSKTISLIINNDIWVK